MADDINQVPGEEDSANMENTLPESGSLGDQAGTSDLGSSPSADITGTSTQVDSGFGERLDTDTADTAEGFDDTAGDTQHEGMLDKAKDKYREIMSDDK